MKNILITGVKGQLGSEIKNHVISQVDHDFNFIYTDVEDYDITDYAEGEKIFSENDIDIVINCAAYTDTNKAELPEEKDKVFAINTVGPMNLARLCKKFNATLIHISTDYVFDGTKASPYLPEDSKLIFDEGGKVINGPKTFYGLTKLLAEQEITESGCNYIIIRTSWLYSSYGKNNFVKKIMRKCLASNKEESICVVDDEIGTPTNAADLADFIIKDIIFAGKENLTGVYHYTNEGVCSRADFARIIAREFRKQCFNEIYVLNQDYNLIPIDYVPSRKFEKTIKRPMIAILDKHSTIEAFNIKLNPWEYSLSECIQKIVKDEGMNF